IEIAAVGLECKHVACFDLKTFLRVNIETFNWICPICHNIFKPGMLALDMKMNSILTNTSVDCSKVKFDATGNWKEVHDSNHCLVELDK
ncbi:zinc finger MIZ domain-containing protein 1-like isoform X5, partial [Leptotrombidium deliense]